MKNDKIDLTTVEGTKLWLAGAPPPKLKYHYVSGNKAKKRLEELNLLDHLDGHVSHYMAQRSKETDNNVFASFLSFHGLEAEFSHLTNEFGVMGVVVEPEGTRNYLMFLAESGGNNDEDMEASAFFTNRVKALALSYQDEQSYNATIHEGVNRG